MKRTGRKDHEERKEEGREEENNCKRKEKG